MATTNEAAARGLFVALSELPKEGRGTRKRGMRARVPSDAIEFAARYLDASNALTMIESWMAEDHPNPHGVGRPQAIPTRTYIVAALACALAGVPITYAQIHHVITGDLPRASRATLGLPVNDDRKADDRIEAARRKVSYYALTRLAAKVAATFDPKVYPSKRAMTREELDRLDAQRDPEDVARKQKRSDALCSALLLPAWLMLPDEVRAKWNGDITLDATVVKAYGKRGNHGRRKVKDAYSPEANAGWHAKTQDLRDTAQERGRPSQETVYTWGYDAHLALATGDGVGRDFPPLLLGMSLDTPGRQPGHNAVAALDGIVTAGLPTGRLTTDMGYSQLKAENFHLPIRAQGYEPVLMYKTTELGVQAEYKGAVMVEGIWYGPCMPPALINATIDYRVHGTISESVWRDRLEARRPYELRLKSHGKDGVTFVMRCPSQGKGRCMSCELRPESLALPKGAKPLPVVVKTPEHLGAVCTNKESITIPIEVGARYWQPLAYETPEWRAVYTSQRNQIEGKNRYIKASTDAAIADPDQRRFRGMGKQVFALLTKIIAANVQTILTFLDLRDRTAQEPPPRRPPRSATPGLEQYLPEPHGPPIRIAGRPIENNPKAA